ncbi:MAG: glutamyl-tRNA reductase [Rhodospirillaceae bacterium]|nr:glutamyl-tRNA reductase [Rhodospirillaceae bacterium]
MSNQSPKHDKPAGSPLVVGANHKSSSMILRDRLFIEEDAYAGVLEALRREGVTEALLLSTCDRIEVQAFCEDRPGEDMPSRVLKVLAEHGEIDPSELNGQTYVYWDEDAIHQIFSVTASLDSLIVGEPQVLGQVKASHRVSQDTGMAGRGLETIMQAAYATAKRVRSETAIGERPVSIATATTQVAGDLHGDLAGCRALLVGVGEMGELIAGEMLSAGLGRLLVTHPQAKRADELAARLSCHTAEFKDLQSQLIEADIILASLGQRHHVIDAAMMKIALSARRHKPVFLVDAGVPGDLDPAIGRLEDAFLYDLGDLDRVAMEGRAIRENESVAAKLIVSEEVASFLRGQAERVAVPALSQLREHFDKERVKALSDADGDADKATRLLVNRLLHMPSEQLRDAAKSEGSNWQMMEKLVGRLFGLGKNRDPKE